MAQRALVRLLVTVEDGMTKTEIAALMGRVLHTSDLREDLKDPWIVCTQLEEISESEPGDKDQNP